MKPALEKNKIPLIKTLFDWSFLQRDQDLDKLCVIHRYRPHSVDIAPITENGKVSNYVMHVGSALHSKNYVEYYMKEGTHLLSTSGYAALVQHNSSFESVTLHI